MYRSSFDLNETEIFDIEIFACNYLEEEMWQKSICQTFKIDVPPSFWKRQQR